MPRGGGGGAQQQLGPDGKPRPKSKVSHIERLRVLRNEVKGKVYFGNLHRAQSRKLVDQAETERERDQRRMDERSRLNREARETDTRGALLGGGGDGSDDGDVADFDPDEKDLNDMDQQADPALWSAAKRKKLRQLEMQRRERSQMLDVRMLPFDLVQDLIREILTERWLLRDILLHLPFLAMFFVFFIGRRKFGPEFFAIDAAYKELAVEWMPPTHPLQPNAEPNGLQYYPKTFEDLGNNQDWYDFLETVAVPKLFPVQTTPPQRVRFAGEMVPLGKVRFRFKHVREGGCTPNPQWYPANQTLWPRECYSDYSPGLERKDLLEFIPGTSFTYLPCEASVLKTVGRLNTYDCGGYGVDITPSTNRTAAYNLVRRFRDGKMMNPLTIRLAMLEMLTFIPEINAFLIVKLGAEVTAGGGWITWNYIRTFRAHDGSPTWLAVDIIFSAQVLFAIYRCWEDYQKTRELEGSKAAFFMDFFNLMTLCNNGLFVAAMTIHWIYIGISFTIPTLFEPGTPETEGQYPTKLAEIEELSRITLIINSANAVLSTLVLLKFAQTNRRLNILQRTIAGSIGHLLSVLLIFMLVVVAYALAGNLLFGAVLAEYRSVPEAMVANFRALLGDFKWHRMFNANRWLAHAYFWSFVVIGLFIMLNFIVAILMRGFEEEAGKTRRVGFTQALANAMRRSEGACNNLVITLSNLIRGRETPESMLYTGMKTMAKEFSDRGAVDFSQIFISREEFTGAIPPVDRNLYGDAYFDALWLSFIDELDMRSRTRNDQELASVSVQIYENARDGAIEVFGEYQRRLLGVHEQPEEHMVEAVRADLRFQKKRQKVNFITPELLEEEEGVLVAFDSEEQRLALHTSYSVQTALGGRSWPFTVDVEENGQLVLAQSTLDIVTSLSERLDELFTKFRLEGDMGRDAPTEKEEFRRFDAEQLQHKELRWRTRMDRRHRRKEKLRRQQLIEQGLDPGVQQMQTSAGKSVRMDQISSPMFTSGDDFDFDVDGDDLEAFDSDNSEDQPPEYALIFPEGEGLLRDIRAQLNDVMTVIERFHAHPNHERLVRDYKIRYGLLEADPDEDAEYFEFNGDARRTASGSSRSGSVFNVPALTGLGGRRGSKWR